MYKGEGGWAPKHHGPVAVGLEVTLLGSRRTTTYGYPFPCARIWFMHASCMLDRAEHLATGCADPRPRVGCQSAWPGAGTRAAYNQARGEVGDNEERLKFVAILQRDVLGPEPVS